MKAVFFSSLLFTALALSASVAHALELLNKIDLPADEYLVVQQIYRGWALLGIVVFGSLLSTLALTILIRGDSKVFPRVFTAFLCIVGTQVIFWIFTFPVNQQTENWTRLPENWMQLRNQWEYSHAAGCALNLIAMVSLFMAALARYSESAFNFTG